jgi:catechol-2,3-dioxygenase
MHDVSLVLDHVQMPARDPESLARWYAQTFDLQAQGNRVCGPGLLIVFLPGEPAKRAPELHFGLHVPSMDALAGWAERLGTTVISGRTEYASVFTMDPEGNGVELYCLASA